jgi:hypothetical protein
MMRRCSHCTLSNKASFLLSSKGKTLQNNQVRTSAIAALLLTLSIAIAGCSGGSSSSTPAPTASPAPAYETATCNTSGTTSAAITGGSVVGLTSITSPAVGGCSITTGLGTVFVNATAGTYSGTISLTAPTGLAAIPSSNTCTNSCGNNGPPPGFTSANFVPLFYVTFLLNGYVGTFSQNNPSDTITVNSLTAGTNTSNFFTGSWNAQVAGTTQPAVSSAAFTGWSNNDSSSSTTFADVPLTVTPPNTLTLPAETCAPASGCTPGSFTAPGESLTVVTVVGYFT